MNDLKECALVALAMILVAFFLNNVVSCAENDAKQMHDYRVESLKRICREKP